MVPVIGVIGGGQLARMMVPAAVELGIELRVLAEQPGASARLAATQVGDFTDLDTVLEFARGVDVITFDHEHVPQPVLRALVAAGVAVHPGPDALQFAQDKLAMRHRLHALGAPQPEWAAVTSPSELQTFVDAHGGAAIVKTPRGGYDGHGVRVVHEGAEAQDWFAAMAESGWDALLAEERVDFRRELAQLVARRPSGDVRSWPLVETVQQEGVCKEVFAPAAVSERVNSVARTVAEQIATELEVTGVLAVELFETSDDRILVNELAMRPHNSGHWTIDGARTSQFEQHVRAVLDLPLGAPDQLEHAAVMINILGGPAQGEITDRFGAALSRYPNAKLHTYGKSARPGRKVGHVTVSGADMAEVAADARGAAAHFDDAQKGERS